MSLRSVGNIHHPININRDSTVVGVTGWHQFLAKTAAGKSCRVLIVVLEVVVVVIAVVVTVVVVDVIVISI